MKFACLLILLSFVFPVINAEILESHDLQNTEKEEHTAVHATQKKEKEHYYDTSKEKLNYINLPHFKNTLGSLIDWNPMKTEAEKAETDEIVKCTSKVVDAIITYQLMLNDKCNRKKDDGNLEKAVYGCCRDNNLSYCTSIDQLEKFNGHTTTKGEKRVCLDEKDGKLEQMFRTFENMPFYWEYFARNLPAYIEVACQQSVELTGKTCLDYMLMDHPELYLNKLTIRQLFKDLNLERPKVFDKIVISSMGDSPIYQFKRQDTLGTKIDEKRPSLRCDKPE